MKPILIVSVLLASLFIIKTQFFKSSEKMTYEEAKRLSKETHKSIILNLTADNCQFCTKMNREVLEQVDVKNFLDKHFILVSINVDKEPIPLGIQRDITPTFVFVNEHEEIHSTLVGAWNKKDFMDLLNNRI